MIGKVLSPVLVFAALLLPSCSDASQPRKQGEGSANATSARCKLLRRVDVGGQANVGPSSPAMPNIIAPTQGKELLWVEFQLTHAEGLPSKLDLRTVEVEDGSGTRHPLMAFGVGPSMGAPQVEYLVSTKNLEAPWMALLTPVKAKDSFEFRAKGGELVGKAGMNLERDGVAELTLIKLPITLRLLFAVPVGGKGFAVKGVPCPPLTVEDSGAAELPPRRTPAPAALLPPSETVRAVQKAIASGGDLNAQNGFGQTLLQKAAFEGDEKTVELLLAKGAKVNGRSREGDTALHEAARMGRKAVVTALVAKGADVNAKGRFGETPLHNSAGCLHDDVDSVAFLISKGAQVNAIDNSGETPLHKAAWPGNKAVVELLIAKGADINARSTGGETPLDTAKRSQRQAMVELLRKHGARGKE